MTRINTNVSSLIAQTNLSRVNNDLQIRLTRLSTGLRINSGKDDPAGLIASENLRRDITSLERAISNSERANQVIATADSALGQVSSLLNDIRGLVVEAANTGALSEEQIAANQLQVDSSLEAINRIAQTTEFQGRKLLNGSLDFTTTAGANFGNIRDLKIDQANLGATGSVAVAVEVTTAATRATVDITGIDLTSAAAQGVNEATINATATAASGTLSITDGTDTIQFNVTAANTGVQYNGPYTITVNDTGVGGLAVTGAGATITIDLGGDAVTGTTLAAALQGDARFTTVTAASGGATAVSTSFAAATNDNTLSGGQDTTSAVITVTTTQNTNNYNSTGLTFIQDATLAANTAVASYNSANDNIEVRINGNRTYQQVADAISALDDFSAAVTTGTATDEIHGGSLTVAVANTTVGNPGGLSKDVVFELSGLTGSEVFNFQAGTSLANVVASINLFTDATGVTASGSSTTLSLASSAYGTRAFVDVKVLSENASGDFTTAIGQGARDNGTDAVARVNGLLATADGNKISINTPALDLSSDLAAAFTGTINFNIIGGGSLFQIGPDVVSNQQARIGITSLNTGRLGGTSGRLYQLQSGGSAALAVDPTLAANIVDEAIDKVTSLRGRLGAFQKTTLESNIATLNDTVANLTEAESSIRDADFAKESAKLTRAQILTQSTTSILAIANSNPQNVLALLGR